MEVHLIAAMGQNREIGYKGGLPWGRIPEDLKRFRRLTKGWPVIMGRKTWKSIPERFRPLSNRHNVVLTTKPPFYTMGSMNSVEYARNVENTLLRFKHWDKVYIIGGARVYEQTIDIADQLEITLIRDSFEADTFFPEITDEFTYSGNAEFGKTKEGLEYEFWTYRRK